MTLSIFCLRTLRISVTIAAVAVWAFGQQQFAYTVSYSTGEPGKLRVSISAREPVKGTIAFVIPRAIPSGYGLQYYDRYVENVKAYEASGTSLKVERAPDGPRWNVETPGLGLSRIDYEVDLKALEMGILNASDQSIARNGYLGMLGYSVLGYLDGLDDKPVSLKIKGPSDWPVFTTLAPKVPAEKGETSARAADFFELADSQIMMGPDLQLRKLDTEPPSYLALYSETPTDIDKHAEVFASAVRKVVAYFGDAPFKSYTAHIEILKPASPQHQYGFSMEHLQSGTFYLGPDRAYTKDTTPDQYARDESNYIHHVAHSWVPKKVYGVGYLPFTWELPPLIDTVWFNEGFARFAMIEVRADSMSPEEGKRYRKENIASLQNWVDSQPAFIRDMSLVELSRIGSLMYSEDFRTGRTLFSKGALMADEMDRLIRKETSGKKGLRDSLRAMVAWGLKNKRPFTLEEFPGLIAKPVGVDEKDISAIVQRWLDRQEN
jgi:predicted metalloprotease with PDZ domain